MAGKSTYSFFRSYILYPLFSAFFHHPYIKGYFKNKFALFKHISLHRQPYMGNFYVLPRRETGRKIKKEE